MNETSDNTIETTQKKLEKRKTKLNDQKVLFAEQV